MSQPNEPGSPSLRGLAIADAANQIDVEPDAAPVRTPGGEPGLRAALERGDAVTEPPVADDVR